MYEFCASDFFQKKTGHTADLAKNDFIKNKNSHNSSFICHYDSENINFKAWYGKCHFIKQHEIKT